MSALVFDTLKYTRRLMEAGVPKQQAEVQAETMAEAFVFNVDALVTRDYLDARLGEQDARIEQRFTEQDARIDQRFTELGANVDQRFTELDASIDRRFAGLEPRFAQQELGFEREISKVKSQLRLHSWMLAIIAVSTVAPAVRALLGY